MSSFPFEFGNFSFFCNSIALTLCPLVGPDGGIEPSCYARNVELAGTLIFEPGECKEALRWGRFYLTIEARVLVKPCR
jgi:hypothetical protein